MRRLFAMLVAVALVGFLAASSAEAGNPYGAGWDRWGAYGTNWEVYGQGNYGYPYSGYGRAYCYSWGGTDAVRYDYHPGTPGQIVVPAVQQPMP